jgi:hypothetical protein
MNVPLGSEDSSRIESIVARAETQLDAVEDHETSVVFSNGMKITGYTVSQGPFQAGDTIGMSLRWSLPPTRPIPKDFIVWVHFIGPDGGKTFQFDHLLVEDLPFPQRPERLVPILTQETEIPVFALPGKHRVEVGLWVPIRDWRPRIVSSVLPHTRDSVTLTEITIKPR